MKRYAVTLGLLAAAGPIAAQDAYVALSEPAWLGVGYDIRWIQQDRTCQPQVVVESVVQGAPAERAGLRPGDAIIAMQGQPLEGRQLRYVVSRLQPGDSVSMRVARAGHVHEIRAVADRRPARPPSVLLPKDENFIRRTSAPLVSLTADTLIVENLNPGSAYGSSRGYWFVDGGRTVYRPLSRTPVTDVDRRFRQLLLCADSVTASAHLHPSVAGSVRVREIQSRADSLRLVIARRALSRADEVSPDELVERLRIESAASDGSGRTTTWQSGDGARAFSFEVRSVHEERGLAGAEMITLESELAGYFRGARQGVLVLRVPEGTPAAEAGLRPGDVVTAGNGRTVETTDDLRRLLARPESSPVELRVVRHGRTRTLTIRR